MGLGPIPEVEEIQDIVERVLFEVRFYRTAKAYIIYRDQHARIRDILERANADLVENYLQKLDWKIKENSNMSYSLQGANNHFSSSVASLYWLNPGPTEHVETRMTPLHEHINQVFSDLAFGKEHLEDLVPEDLLQMFQFE